MEMTIQRGHKVEYFYMVRQGNVNLFDEKFNFMYELKQGSYFGEFNVMFDTYSEHYYKTTLTKNQYKCTNSHTRKDMMQTLLFKIEAEVFLEIICKDPKLFMIIFRTSV